MADWFKEWAGKKGRESSERKAAEEKARAERETQKSAESRERRSTVEQIREDRSRTGSELEKVGEKVGLLGSDHGGRRTA